MSSTSSTSAPASLATTVSVGDRPGCSPNPKASASAAPTIAGSVTGTRSTYQAPPDVTAADVLGDGQRQPGLAHAAGADGRDQPMLR